MSWKSEALTSYETYEAWLDMQHVAKLKHYKQTMVVNIYHMTLTPTSRPTALYAVSQCMTHLRRMAYQNTSIIPYWSTCM